MANRLPYKYFATRLANTNIVVIRKTVKHIQMVRSKLYRPGSEFNLTYVSFVGGRVVGTIGSNEFYKRTKLLIQPLKCQKMTREQVTALKPFLQKGD